MSRTKPPAPPARRSAPPNDGIKSQPPPKPRRSSIPAPAQATIRKLMMPTAPRPPRPVGNRTSAPPGQRPSAPPGQRPSAPPDRRSEPPRQDAASQPSPPKRSPSPPKRSSAPPQKKRSSVAPTGRASVAPKSRGKKKRKKKAAAKQAGVETAPAVLSTTAEKREKSSSPRYGLMLLVGAAAAVATIWVLRSEKADDSSAREVAEQDPIVSTAQKDEVKKEGSTKDSEAAGAKQPDPSNSDDAAEEDEKPTGKTGDAKAANTETKQANFPGKPSEPSKLDAKDNAKAKKDSAEKAADDDKVDEPKEAVAEAPAPTLPPFDQGAAKAALGAAAAQASSCRKGNDPAGNAEVLITFAPSGRVTSANVAGGPFAGTATGGCVASTLRRAKVPPFSGKHVTVRKVVRLN